MNYARRKLYFLQDCIGRDSVRKGFEDDRIAAFNDINPQAPIHNLIVPKQHIDSLDKAEDSDRDILGQLLLTAAGIARRNGFAEAGYRVVINTNSDGGKLFSISTFIC